MLRKPLPIGVVLAGGRARRMGGSKVTLPLRGRPLIDYPLTALRTVLAEVAVISKPDVELPPLSGVTVWIEPAEPHHPLVGIVEALALAAGRSVLVCPADLPLLTPTLVSQIVQTRPDGAPAVIASHRGRTQPLLGCYQPEAAELLIGAARRAELPVRDVVAAMGARELEVSDPDELFNVNSPEDLLMAQWLLDQPKVKS